MLLGRLTYKLPTIQHSLLFIKYDLCWYGGKKFNIGTLDMTKHVKGNDPHNVLYVETTRSPVFKAFCLIVIKTDIWCVAAASLVV